MRDVAFTIIIHLALAPVNYSSEYTDVSIRKRIQDRPAENAETRWVADDIKVTVSNGKAAFVGTVNYRSEYDAARMSPSMLTASWRLSTNSRFVIMMTMSDPRSYTHIFNSTIPA